MAKLRIAHASMHGAWAKSNAWTFPDPVCLSVPMSAAYSAAAACSVGVIKQLTELRRKLEHFVDCRRQTLASKNYQDENTSHCYHIVIPASSGRKTEL